MKCTSAFQVPTRALVLPVMPRLEPHVKMGTDVQRVIHVTPRVSVLQLQKRLVVRLGRVRIQSPATLPQATVSQLLRSQEFHAALSAKLTLHVMAQVAVLVEQTFPQAVHVMILIVVPMMMYVMALVSALVPDSC